MPQIIHMLQFCLVDMFLSYVPNFVVNGIEVMDTRRPQICRDECMAVGFTQPLRTASLQTLQANIAMDDNSLQRTGRDPSLSLSGLWPAFFAKCQLHHRSHIFFIECACTSACYWLLPCLWSMLPVSRSLLSNLSSPSFVQFYPKIYPLKFAAQNCPQKL